MTEPMKEDRERAEDIIANDIAFEGYLIPAHIDAQNRRKAKEAITAALAAVRAERGEELVAAAREAGEYLDRISDEWDHSPVDTVFNHDKAHKAYLISEKINAALVERVEK